MVPSLAALLLCLIALFAPVDAKAEDAGRVTIGTRIRVVAPRIAERSFIGVLQAFDGDDLLVRREGSTDPIAVPRVGITTLEVSRGRKSKAKGALIGGVVGAGAGAALGAAASSPCTPSSDPACVLATGLLSESKGAYIAVGSLVGAGVGALVGTLLVRGEKWQIVSTDKVSISLLTPGARAVGLRLTMAF